jgi:RecG-like helicase
MGFRSWIDSVIKSSADIDAAELRVESELFGADAIAELLSGQVTTLTGKVQSLVFRPETSVPVLEAELFDGSGTVVIKFMGRRRIQGINPGTNIAVTGRIVRCDGVMTMFNPEYKLLPRTEVA